MPGKERYTRVFYPLDVTNGDAVCNSLQTRDIRACPAALENLSKPMLRCVRSYMEYEPG